jgi:predicted Rossmann fold nucleotide-binding protein DprA/Smf involved in DNA uptake
VPVSRRYAIVGGRPPKRPASKEDLVHFERVLQHVREYVGTLPDDVVVISGGADGVDDAAAAAARARGLEVVEHLPDYKSYSGRMAPLVRNRLIVEDCDVLVAFPAPWSTGTWHAVRLATDAKKEVSVRKIEILPPVELKDDP